MRGKAITLLLSIILGNQAKGKCENSWKAYGCMRLADSRHCIIIQNCIAFMQEKGEQYALTIVALEEKLLPLVEREQALERENGQLREQLADQTDKGGVGNCEPGVAGWLSLDIAPPIVHYGNLYMC